MTCVLTHYKEEPTGERRGMPRGSWHASDSYPIPRVAHEVGGRQVNVTICCPGCGNQFTLSRENHVIALDGTVTPSMVCPLAVEPEVKRCMWHVFGRLEGWPP